MTRCRTAFLDLRIPYHDCPAGVSSLKRERLLEGKIRSITFRMRCPITNSWGIAMRIFCQSRDNRLVLLIFGAQTSLEFVVRVLPAGERRRVPAAIWVMPRGESAPGAPQLRRVQRLRDGGRALPVGLWAALAIGAIPSSVPAMSWCAHGVPRWSHPATGCTSLRVALLACCLGVLLRSVSISLVRRNLFRRRLFGRDLLRRYFLGRPLRGRLAAGTRAARQPCQRPSEAPETIDRAGSSNSPAAQPNSSL